jgi:hypothetical protein
MNDDVKRGIDAIMHLRDSDLGPGPTRAAFIEGLLAEAGVPEVIDDWFTFDAARRWMDGTLAPVDPRWTPGTPERDRPCPES